RGHVREHDVHRTADPLPQLIDGRSISEVTRDEMYVGRLQGLDLDQVDAEDRALWPHALQRNLQPSSRPGSEVHDHVTAVKEAEPLAQLGELVGASRPITLGPSPAVVRVLPPISHAARV